MISGTETVLVVEDEEMARRLSHEVPEEGGHRVVTAADGAEALHLLDAHPEVALIFTDVVLGEPMSGRDLEESARRRPGLPVLYATGHDREVIVHDGRRDDGVDVLPKPFAAADLLARVGAALRRPATVAG